MTALKIITIILFILLTIVTVKMHPEMHQPMLIEPANFKVVRESDYLMNRETMPVAKTTATKEIKVNTTAPEPKTETKYVQTYSTPEYEQEKTVYMPQPQKKETTKTVNTASNNDADIEMLQKLIDNQARKLEQVQTPSQEEEIVLAQPQPKPQQVQKPVQSQNRNPYMTEEEEIIAWNKWRSDIQNQIMMDSNIDYAPLGTIFLFSCVVDKYGNVSNIKTWTSNPNYTSVAKENVKPAIANLQGKPILKFPRGTQRTSTVFTGAFLIGVEDRYSTPNDYADFEKVMRYVQH